MRFRFEFVGARHCRGDPHSLQSLPHLRLFGRLTAGSVQMGDSIIIPTRQGCVMARVDQFWDTLYDWFGMPFYEAVHLETMPDPFCLIIHGFPEHAAPSCPGFAYGADDPLPHNR